MIPLAGAAANNNGFLAAFVRGLQPEHFKHVLWLITFIVLYFAIGRHIDEDSWKVSARSASAYPYYLPWHPCMNMHPWQPCMQANMQLLVDLINPSKCTCPSKNN